MLALVPLRGRDDLIDQVFAPAIQRLWPEFAMHDPAADLYFAEPHFTACLDTAFAVVEPARPAVVLPAVGRQFVAVGGQLVQDPDLRRAPVQSGYHQQGGGRHAARPQPVQQRLHPLEAGGHQVVDGDVGAHGRLRL